MDKVLYLVRGLPGSGKSTFSKNLGGKHFEADMYFTGPDGSYNFVPESISEAHNWCRHSVMDAMKNGEPLVVVSNTFTMKWEMEAYYLLAQELGYMVFSIIVENRHGGKNLHGCPEEKVEIMRGRFEVSL
jgi:predicted kinase